jgi:hypothetical protein
MAVLMLALTLGRSGAGATATAQDPPMAPFEFGELEGARQAVSRTYTIDVASMMESIGTPGPDGELGEIPELSGVVSLAAVIGRFDSGDNAAAAVERVDEETKASLEGQPDAPKLEEAEVDLGGTSRAYTATQEIEGQTLNLSVIIVQQDEFLYFVVAGVIDADAQELVTGFTEALIANEAGDGEPQVNQDGTSTGGLWDKFPEADDALVANLVAFDEQLYPEVESTPAS